MTYRMGTPFVLSGAISLRSYTQRQRDGGELRNERQEINGEQIEEREASPPLAESLVDHRGVALARRNAEPDDPGPCGI